MKDPAIDFESFPEFPQSQEKPAEPSAALTSTPEATPPASAQSPMEALPVETETAPIEIENPSAKVPESVAEEAPDANETAIEIENYDSSSPVESTTIEKNERRVSLMQSARNSFENVRGRIKSLQTRVSRRETKLARIMESARERGSTSNDDIEKLLHVSDKSATRYTNILVQRGELIRAGKGRNIRYTPRG